MALLDRRRFLQATFAAGLSGLAGCTSSLPDLPGGGGTPGYTDWVRNHHDTEGRGVRTGVHAIDHTAFRANEQHFSAETYQHYEDTTGPHFDGLAHDSLDTTAVPLPSGTGVFTGSFDADAVASRLGSTWSEGTTHEGFDIYTAEHQMRSGLALADGTAIVRSTPQQAAMKALIDVGTGSGPRAYEENDDFATLTDELGESAMVEGVVRDRVQMAEPQRRRFQNAVADGYTFDLHGETYDARLVVVFDEAANAATEPVRQYVESDQSNRRNPVVSASEFSLSKSGRVVVATGSGKTSEVFL
ncbi:hypothetical protein [Haloarchaeobius sp. DFWS5]|uniref:hypothetical protein n=1 Tax=Haloarchaeobius sp. DFWS5 TaxID=3446114 RepID=UPI003EB9AB8B